MHTQYPHTMEYYSVVKNEVSLFAATCRDWGHYAK